MSTAVLLTIIVIGAFLGSSLAVLAATIHTDWKARDEFDCDDLTAMREYLAALDRHTAAADLLAATNMRRTKAWEKLHEQIIERSRNLDQET